VAERSPGRRMLRNWLIRLAVLVAVVLVVVLAVWVPIRLLTSPARVLRMAREKLAAELGCHVEVGSARFGLLSETVLGDIVLREAPDSEPWASVRTVHLRHRVAGLLRGKLEVTTVHAVEPRLVLTDASIERLRQLARKPRGEGLFPSAIVVEQGALEVRKSAGIGGLGELLVSPISVRLSNPDERGRLIHLVAELGFPAGSVAADAQIDSTASAARFHAAASDLRLAMIPREWLPERLRARREVREVRGVLSGEADGRVAWGGAKPTASYVARLRFDDVSFQPQEVGLPVHDLAGDATVRGGRLALADVVGRVGRSRFELEDLELTFDAQGGPPEVCFRGSVYDVDLDGPVRAALPKAVQEAWEQLGIASGTADVEVRFSQRGGERPQAGLEMELRDVAVKPENFPYALPPVSGRLRYDSARDILVLDDIEGSNGGLSLELDGTVHLRSDPPAVRVRLRARGVPLDDRLLKALPPEAASVWKELGIVEGNFDADVRASGQPGKDIRVGASVDVRELRLRPEVFPYDLPPLAGRMRLSPARKLHIERLDGNRGGLGLSVSGTVHASGEKPVLRLNITAAGLPVDDRLAKALPEAAREGLAEAGLAGGTIDVGLSVRGAADEIDVDADVTLRGCSARPKAFPYPIEKLSGRVQWAEKTKTLTLESVVGFREATRLAASGQMRLSQPQRPAFQLALQANNLVLDEKLRAALPAEWQKLWKQHQPRGSIDVRGHLTSTDEGKLTFQGMTTLRGCSLVAAELPRRLDDITGTVEIGPGAIRLDNIVATAGTCRIQANAVYRTGDGGGRLESLSVIAADLQLDDALIAALPKPIGDKLKPHAPVGGLDVRLAYFDSGKEPPRTRFSAVLRDVAVNATPDGPRLTNLHGEVRSDGQTATLSAIRGRLATIPIDIDGLLALEPRAGATSVHVHLPRLQLTQPLVRQLPERLAPVLELVKPAGTIEASATISTRGDETRPSLAAASLAFQDITLVAKPAIDRLSGTATYVAEAESPGVGALALNLQRARIAGLPLQGISAHGLLKPGSLDIRDVDWTLYGGRISGELRVERAETPAYAGRFQISHLDLESLVTAFGDLKNAPSGWLRGTVNFKGKGRKLRGLDLSGVCKVDRGRLYELPLIVSVWNFLAFRLPTKGSLSDAHLEFRIRDGVLHIDHFLLTGHSMPLDVTGTISLEPGVKFEDQKIDLLFTVAREPMLLDKLPVVGWVKGQTYGRLTRYFLQARATGTLAHPRIEAVTRLLAAPISGFRSVLRRVAAEGAAVVKRKRP